MNTLVRKLIMLSAVAVATFAAPAFALDTGDIVVASIKGEVHVTMNGVEKTLRAGGVLVPPAAVRTGRDGSIELRQGATSVNVGPDTQLEFPALETAGGPIDRVVQSRGHAFYDIGKRAGRRMRVEAPYLVGVIKGTQFNVAATESATTISLFEGRLDVHATDESDVVDLLAGNIATRKRGDKSITVIKMEAGKAPPTQRSSQGGSAGQPVANRDNDDVSGNVSATLRPVTDPETVGQVGQVDDTRATANVDVRANVPATDVGVNAGVDIAAGANGVTAGVDVSAG